MLLATVLLVEAIEAPNVQVAGAAACLGSRGQRTGLQLGTDAACLLALTRKAITDQRLWWRSQKSTPAPGARQRLEQ